MDTNDEEYMTQCVFPSERSLFSAYVYHYTLSVCFEAANTLPSLEQMTQALVLRSLVWRLVMCLFLSFSPLGLSGGHLDTEFKGALSFSHRFCFREFSFYCASLCFPSLMFYSFNHRLRLPLSWLLPSSGLKKSLLLLLWRDLGILERF